MRRFAIVCCLTGFATLGCGQAVDLPTYPDEAGDGEQIQIVVEYFNIATEGLDAEVLCEEVIAPSRQGGSEGDCTDLVAAAMEGAPENWRPITDLTEIQVSSDYAEASGMQLREVRGGSEAEQPISLEFVRESGRWWMQVFD